MAKNVSEKSLLQNYGVLFYNVVKDTELSRELEEYGYDAAEVANGKALYDNLVQLYDDNVKETAEEITAYKKFTDLFDALINTYTTDRKKAKIIFKEKPEVLTNLKIKGVQPRRNAVILDSIKIFYQAIQNNPDLLQPLQRLKINAVHVQNQLNQLQAVERAYADYIQEKGESQQATKNKDMAFKTLEKWIREFYAIAKIALEDKPQLLESVAKLVRS